MRQEYSVETISRLKEIFNAQKIFRPLRVNRYDAGDVLEYEARGVTPAADFWVKLEIEKYVGGGFAGQVYRVVVLELDDRGKSFPALEEGKAYALKILAPASGFGRWVRNLFYGLSFQGPFSAQINPDAVRAGALWQKLIRRAAGLRLGSSRTVVDVLAAVIDRNLGSCGEISEWVDGRIWRFEVDDDLDSRRKWKVGDSLENQNSTEYLAKKTFMSGLVELMHDMGAHELARQYEWGTLKSQPNALKRLESEGDPEKGHCAVDFRAGMALLPFLPQCPADFRLIWRGIKRGSWVQFDRGDFAKLKAFADANPGIFTGMEDVLEELPRLDLAYRESLPDVSHHRFRVFYDRRLWSAIFKSSIRGWEIRGQIDDVAEEKLKTSRFRRIFFYLLGGIPFLGKLCRRFLGVAKIRRHYLRMISNWDYFRRAGRARIAAALIRWHRAGRVSSPRAERIAGSLPRYFAHLPLSLLPAGLHRFLSDRQTFKQKLDAIFARPLRLYFRAEEREKWLRDMIKRGHKNGMLTDSEAGRIEAQIKEPYIQKYLKSLAVHVCTVPVTQIVSVLVAIIYVRLHPELSWQEASVHAGLILGLFQVIPISPGSLARGLYVTFLVLKERNFKDYQIAFFLSFFKYIGYLAFPIQMAYRYPDLARFMAGNWATEAVHIVPIFGEKGALLEHTVFDMFYNYPLTVRRRLQERQQRRQAKKPRARHVIPMILAGTAGLAGLDLVYYFAAGRVPGFRDVWFAAIWIPVIAAVGTAAWAGGSSTARRIIYGGVTGAVIGVLYALVNTALGSYGLIPAPADFSLLHFAGKAAPSALWKFFLFAILAFAAACIEEIRPLRPLK